MELILQSYLAAISNLLMGVESKFWWGNGEYVPDLPDLREDLCVLARMTHRVAKYDIWL